MLGAFQPGRLPVDLESIYVRADDPGFGGAEARRIAAAGRLPMVSIEPHEWPTDAHLRDWHGALLGQADDFIPVLVRYMHEQNGNWYPWGNDPARFLREWERFADAMPGNVETVWSPNVGFPGSLPMADFWPREQGADWLAVDGYSWHGESFDDVFRASLATLRTIAPELPVMIAETAYPRGSGQTAYARDAARAVARGDVQAVVWFDLDKERRWKLSNAAAKAFVGGRR